MRHRKSVSFAELDDAVAAAVGGPGGVGGQDEQISCWVSGLKRL
jgi:hypothetical protein